MCESQIWMTLQEGAKHTVVFFFGHKGRIIGATWYWSILSAQKWIKLHLTCNSRLTNDRSPLFVRSTVLAYSETTDGHRRWDNSERILYLCTWLGTTVTVTVVSPHRTERGQKRTSSHPTLQANLWHRDWCERLPFMKCTDADSINNHITQTKQ